ncbi:carbamoyltransferase HypF [Clostridium sp.]|uniref:carbamoyltransferase HypF n=1 Tax=Clostridium sp. TaxID=1506 RepID=UPI002FCC24FE
MTYRYLIKICGIVQGVGFRPYVYNSAVDKDLKGWVGNEGSSLIIDIEGEKSSIKNFLLKIIKQPPNMAEIRKIHIDKVKPLGYEVFKINKSKESKEEARYLLADIATCKDCIEDIKDEKNIWYKYAFTSCTNCGPRYSIMNSFPYDRDTTAMEDFPMCSSCSKKYKSHTDRRFHAQTVCCPSCGPDLILVDNKGEDLYSKDIIKEVANLIKNGKIIAIKGIGGFHLCCDAFNETAVETLRIRKIRPHKPLALMIKNIETIKNYVYVDEIEENLLKSPKAPIVLLRKKQDKKEFKKLSNYVAPKMKYLGIMLPYTPLHHLIFNENIEALVMTSGNISGDTVEYENSKALEKLKQIADYFLIHNRMINIPIDDSVVKVVRNKVLISRVGRGYAPYYVNADTKYNVLATGSEMKNTFALCSENISVMSQYCGDLKNFNVYEEYLHSINNMKKLLNFKPEYLAIDCHPNFITREYEDLDNCKVIQVQHHFAHMVSCLTEHNIEDKAIGVIYDGVGYGDDGKIWGGEFLVGDKKSFKRIGHYKYVKIQGGDSATKNIYKVALSFVEEIQEEGIRSCGIKGISASLKNFLNQEEVEVSINNHAMALRNNINCYETSSVGRIFDAVASILGITQKITYDGQGAIELEAEVAMGIDDEYEYKVSLENHEIVVDMTSTFKGIILDKFRGIPIGIIASKFHNTIIGVTLNMVKRIKEITQISLVVLSGGVFENRYLLCNLVDKLEGEKFRVFFNEKIPINDGGISIGQLVAANKIIEG